MAVSAASFSSGHSDSFAADVDTILFSSPTADRRDGEIVKIILRLLLLGDGARRVDRRRRKERQRGWRAGRSRDGSCGGRGRQWLLLSSLRPEIMNCRDQVPSRYAPRFDRRPSLFYDDGAVPSLRCAQKKTTMLHHTQEDSRIIGPPTFITTIWRLRPTTPPAGLRSRYNGSYLSKGLSGSFFLTYRT